MKAGAPLLVGIITLGMAVRWAAGVPLLHTDLVDGSRSRLVGNRAPRRRPSPSILTSSGATTETRGRCRWNRTGQGRPPPPTRKRSRLPRRLRVDDGNGFCSAMRGRHRLRDQAERRAGGAPPRATGYARRAGGLAALGASRLFGVRASGHMLGACMIYHWERDLVVAEVAGRYRVILPGTKAARASFHQEWFSSLSLVGSLGGPEDEGASTWTTPPPRGRSRREVPRAVALAMIRGGGNPGRFGPQQVHRGRPRRAPALESSWRSCSTWGIPSRIVFTKNATESLNVVHARPAPWRRESGHHGHGAQFRPAPAASALLAGVTVRLFPPTRKAGWTRGKSAASLAGETRLVVVTHGSNVTGAVNDIGAMAAACRERRRAAPGRCRPDGRLHPDRPGAHAGGLPGLQRAQGSPRSAGHGRSVRAGRKGPAATLRGGTGSLSDREEQPEFLPDRFESGTLNVPGIAGLGEGVRWLLQKGVERVMEHDRLLRRRSLETVAADPRIRVVGRAVSLARRRAPMRCQQRGSPVSIRCDQGRLRRPPRGRLLEKRFGILTRIGLHCAPSAHRSMGTFPDGTVRLSWGVFTTHRQIEMAGRALLSIAAGE